ncbi:hypothetical protein [Frankia sp. AgB32]|uniref:hypothetical protein n=1 Tax=Frankia sp. AgB32 TaxID=631119 RepID=UPI00200FE6B0|nr:hypothetical protein [Frankia sp. AgB32]MCK9895132.1 hypothetical protein [Frankia sp. AgB32]
MSALAPTALDGTAILGTLPSWPLAVTVATVAATMVTAQALARGPGRRRSHLPAAGQDPDRGTTFDHVPFDSLSDRMSVLLRDFLAAAVPRPGRPARVDLRAPATDWFVDAFTAASDLLVGTCQTDCPDPLAAAVREAERRWMLLDGWTRLASGSGRAAPGPEPVGQGEPDDPGGLGPEQRWR